jgi:HK97 family phage portal protein
MNMIERFLSRVRSKTATSNAAYMAASSKIVMGDEGKRQPFSYASAVRSYSSWVYAAANLNAVAVASQPLRLYVRSRDGKKKLWKTRSVSARVKAFHAGDLDHLPSRHVIRKAAEYGDNYEVVTENHPVLDLLEKVNPYQNGFDATVLRILYTELTGNAYLHPVVDKALGVPVELWTMPSQFVEIVPGKVDFIDGYLYGAERDKRRLFPAEEVIHFKRPNPNDLYYGIGKAEAAWGAIMSNDEIHSMDYHFFANKARPDWLMTIKGMVSTDEMDRLEKQIEEKLRGSKRAGRFLTASADIDIKPLSFPPKDLQGRTDIVEEIAAVFGVPVSMLKANDPNLASATIGFAAWKANTILPLLRMDEEVLNQNLLPMFNIEGDAFLAYDNPVLSDERFEFEKNRSSVAGGMMTVNEARTRNGLDASEDPAADRLLMGNQPLGGPTGDPSQPEALPIADPTTPAAEGEQISPIDQPTSAPVPGEAAPSGDAPAVAVDAPAAAALNGAQISSLIGLARSAALAELPIDSVRAIASAAFPSVSPQLIESIFSPITPQQQQQEKPPAAAVPIVAKCAGEKATDLCTSEKIGKLLDEGYDREQAIAIAISMCDDGQTKSLEDIDTTPPQSVADNARRALEVRAEAPESQRGMTAVGIARARDLQNRTPLSEETIRRMVAYFERHEVDKQGESWDEQGKGWQAWNGWGGDEGWSWSKRKRDEFDRARSSDVQTKDCGSGSGGFKPGNSCAGGGDGKGDSATDKGDSDSSSNEGKKPGAWMMKDNYPIDVITSVGHAKLYAVLVAQNLESGLSKQKARSQAQQTIEQTASDDLDDMAAKYAIDMQSKANQGEPGDLKNDPGIAAKEKAIALGLIKPSKSGSQSKVAPIDAEPTAPPAQQSKFPVATSETTKLVDPKTAGPSANPGKAPSLSIVPIGMTETWKDDGYPEATEVQKRAINNVPMAFRAVSEYSATEYRGINRELRDFQLKSNTDEFSQLSRETAIQVASLDAVTRIDVRDKPTAVYRGVKNSQMVKAIDAMGVGSTFTDHGYVSTTSDPSRAILFTDPGDFDPRSPSGESRVLMRITTRQGVAIRDFSSNPTENEVLLPRGARFKITSKEWRRTDKNDAAASLYVELEHLETN